MERQTALAEVIDTVADKAKYDRCAKKLLSFKAIDAWILKTCVKEFSLCSVDYISEHCMSGEVEISEHAVEPFPKKWTRKMRKKQNEANRSE